MLTLIHGDDKVTTRKVLEEKKLEANGNEIVILDGTKISMTDIVSACESISFFAEKKVIIIENLIGKNTLKEKDKVISYLNNLITENTIIICESLEISKTVLTKYFPKAEIILCKSPLLMFRFLDSIGVNAKNTTLALFHSVLRERDANFVLTMLIRQIRYLILAKDPGVNGLSDLSPWQAKKFTQQCRFFEEDHLISNYRQLLALEFNFKTGRTPLPLKELLDIFLVNL